MGLSFTMQVITKESLLAAQVWLISTVIVGVSCVVDIVFL
jgi:hypothetical protein